jgi:hypothetical protein|tara:strand:+ start:242495 stop:242920 length:426 start_codon:yes stop_codon:yes gene_type:complete
MYLSFLRKLSLLSVVAVFAVFTSCNDEKKENSTEDTNENLSEKNVNTPKSTTEASNGDIALNPAHGQPGHRCDIPVGQPLDGSGQQSQTIKSTQQSPVIKSNGSVPVNSNKSTNTNTDGAVNPAHGQPGHRCDIPVGAPLN